MTKKLFRIKFDDGTEGYIVIDPTHRSYYNLDGVLYATEPGGWSPVEMLGEVETADDFEKMTGCRPQIFIEDCRSCGLPALLLVEHDNGICADCQGEGDEEFVN